jgi:VanZ family protein
MLKKILNFLNAYLPPILCAAVIYFLSSQTTLPSLSTSVSDFVFKKTSHMFFFGLLYFLTFRAINFYKEKGKVKNWVAPFIICILYAISDEIHQSFTPHRSPSLRDIGFDSLGAGLAFLKMYQYI